MKNKIVENVFFGIFAKKSVTPIGHYLTWLGHACVYPCYNEKCTKSRALCGTVILLCYRPGKVCNPKSDPRTIKAPVENRHLPGCSIKEKTFDDPHHHHHPHHHFVNQCTPTFF